MPLSRNNNLETIRSRLYQGRKLMQREFFVDLDCGVRHELVADRDRNRRSG